MKGKRLIANGLMGAMLYLTKTILARKRLAIAKVMGSSILELVCQAALILPKARSAKTMAAISLKALSFAQTIKISSFIASGPTAVTPLAVIAKMKFGIAEIMGKYSLLSIR
jgi:hypothetical protein